MRSSRLSRNGGGYTWLFIPRFVVYCRPLSPSDVQVLYRCCIEMQCCWRGMHAVSCKIDGGLNVIIYSVVNSPYHIEVVSVYIYTQVSGVCKGLFVKSFLKPAHAGRWARGTHPSIRNVLPVLQCSMRSYNTVLYILTDRVDLFSDTIIITERLSASYFLILQCCMLSSVEGAVSHSFDDGPTDSVVGLPVTHAFYCRTDRVDRDAPGNLLAKSPISTVY